MNFYKSGETLEAIGSIILKKEKGAYLRFGDGDINLANGESDLLQENNSLLSYEMSEALSMDSKNILKSLPLHCKEYGWEEGMFPGNHECDKTWADNILKKVEPFWGGEVEEVYSPIALHFLASHKPDSAITFLRLLRDSNICCVVGNKRIPRKIIHQVFGQCKHIKTPVNNSYSKIDQIENSLSNVLDKSDDQYKIVVTAMGCSGRVLQKRLLNTYENIFLFDFGSLLDALCGWNTRAWIELSQFDRKNFLSKLNENQYA